MSKKRNKMNIIASQIVIMCLCVLFCTTGKVFAQEDSVKTAIMEGFYRHPYTGIILDSGGESSEALGQSMVQNVIAREGLLETINEKKWLSIRFCMTDSITNIAIFTQKQGEDSWNKVSYEVTDKKEKTKDIRFEIPQENIIIKCECFVEPMGRSVIFFAEIKALESGNAGKFVEMEKPEEVIETQDIKPEDVKAEATKNEVSQTETTIVEKETNQQTQVGEKTIEDIISDTQGVSLGNSQAERVSDFLPEEEMKTSSQLLEIDISQGVWFMLFCVVFSAVCIGNMVSNCAIMLWKKKNQISKMDIEEEIEFPQLEEEEELELFWEKEDEE